MGYTRRDLGRTVAAACLGTAQGAGNHGADENLEIAPCACHNFLLVGVNVIRFTSPFLKACSLKGCVEGAESRREHENWV